MISLARKYPNVYIDTSAYKPSRYPPELVDYLRGGGRKKVLFVDDKTLRLFLHDNARQAFKLP